MFPQWFGIFRPAPAAQHIYQCIKATPHGHPVLFTVSITPRCTDIIATQARRAAEVALDNARRVEAETSHFYHDAVVSARAYVVVQYGPDSAAVAQVGLTRKSDRKRPTRRAEKAR